MDKNAIKKYAVWARNELIARVTQKAEQYEITEKSITPADADSIGGRVLTVTEKKQRQALISKINKDGFGQVMEEVAYTWFNRFTALRFMEVNNYLPSHTRVFTNAQGEFKPQILADAISLDLEGLDMEKVYDLKDANKTEELYKYLLITQCNALSSVLPRMFQKIEHYTELLLPDYLLREGSVIEQMIALIPEEDWTDQVQIIGWLYQFYNIEPKDKVFAALKKKVKISKENIPAATQLFTPDWIVRYMVENSLGRLWLEGHPNDSLKSEWKYYLDEAEQEADAQRQLDEIRKEYAALKPEEIRCIDPCMGSGHILCYMFDVLVKIYEDYGYTAREAVGNIVEKNLWGIDIDERAAQLSYFAVMMKARQYDRRFFNKKDDNGNLCIPQPHVYAIEESNGITSAPMHDMGLNLSQEEYGKAAKEAMRLVEEMHDAKEYGSIIHVTPCDWNLLRRFAVPRGASEGQQRLDIHGEIEASGRLQGLINIAEALAQKYHAVVTNPPYMGKGMSGILSSYLKANYNDSKGDLFSVFIERCRDMTINNGFWSMITQHSWMFLSSFEKLRIKLLDYSLENMCHLGTRAFEEIGGAVVQTTTFVYRKSRVINQKSSFVRLLDYQSQDEKEKAVLNLKEKDLFMSKLSDLSTIEGCPFAYWVTKPFLSALQGDNLVPLTISDGQNKTGDNDTYLREFWEVDNRNVGVNKKWLFYAKGGAYRKWAGNLWEVINWSDEARAHYHADPACRIVKEYLWYKKGITWGIIAQIGFRVLPTYATFDMQGSSVYISDMKYYDSIIAFLNSKVAYEFLQVFNTTLSFQIRDIRNLPFDIKEIDMHKAEIDELSQKCVSLSQKEWDDYETSWDFRRHPLLRPASTIEEAYSEWEIETENRFQSLKKYEEEINRIFIEIYGLQGELTPEVENKDVSIRKADLQREIRSFISYSVGCMFGRYSLGEPGLIYAGGEWDLSKYPKFLPDKDAIIPICDDEYFEDDIVGRFVKFVETVYGDETLEENLHFIADALGGKGSSCEVIRNYFINDFYKDHLKVYQKRPIYWLFDSGKKNGFKCLVYMHRYQPDTIARIRTDYVHEQQSRYRTAIADLENRINGAGTSDRVKLNKQLTTLQAQAEEIRVYEEKIHHLADQMISIDLDDGVKHNYEIFKDVLAKIK